MTAAGTGFRPRRCTGVAAQWCPNCGDCTCIDKTDLNDQTCPLHSSTSGHAVTKSPEPEERG